MKWKIQKGFACDSYKWKIQKRLTRPSAAVVSRVGIDCMWYQFIQKGPEHHVVTCKYCCGAVETG